MGFSFKMYFVLAIGKLPGISQDPFEAGFYTSVKAIKDKPLV